MVPEILSKNASAYCGPPAGELPTPAGGQQSDRQEGQVITEFFSFFIIDLTMIGG